MTAMGKREGGLVKSDFCSEKVKNRGLKKYIISRCGLEVVRDVVA